MEYALYRSILLLYLLVVLLTTTRSADNFNLAILLPFQQCTKETIKSFSGNTNDWDDWDSVKEVRGKPNLVHVKNYYGRGTHTGKPFAFGPYPPIEPKGVVVQDEPIQLYLTIDEETSRIIHCDVQANGNMCGPPGFYTQIGGIIF